jgi:hypothetical protein
MLKFGKVRYRRREDQWRPRFIFEWESMEINCEGSEDFLRQELPKILETVTSLHADQEKVADKQKDTNLGQTNHIKLAITTVASKFACSTGPELVMAAAAKLALIDGLKEFSRDELHNEMKEASGYYKATYGSNLTVNINGLVKSGKLLGISQGKYAVPEQIKTEWRAKLA